VSADYQAYEEALVSHLRVLAKASEKVDLDEHLELECEQELVLEEALDLLSFLVLEVEEVHDQ